MRNFRLLVGRHLTFDRAVIVGMAVLVVFGAIGLIQASKERKQLCAFVDDEHNARRANIVLGERELYTKYAREFEGFIDTARKRRIIHRNNERSYYEVRGTRPPYCEDTRENPVPPYPPLRDFRRPVPTPAVLAALDPPAEPGEPHRETLSKREPSQERQRRTPQGSDPERDQGSNLAPTPRAGQSRTTGRSRRETPAPAPPAPAPASEGEPAPSEPEPVPELPPATPEPMPPDRPCVELPTDTEVCLPAQ